MERVTLVPPPPPAETDAVTRLHQQLYTVEGHVVADGTRSVGRRLARTDLGANVIPAAYSNFMDSGSHRVVGAASTVPAPVKAPRAVIFDGDDTLWLTEHLYDAARSAARAIVERAGFDGAEWENRQRTLDVANVRTAGHSPSRFPTSCVQALDAVTGMTDGMGKVRETVWMAAQQVFTAEAPLCPDAIDVVSTLVRRGLRLALLTKGDADVQTRRIDRSGLRSYLDVVEIVATKSPADFRRVVARLDLEPHEVVSVGNSVRSDIWPSVEAGVDAIWLPAHVWEYEQCDDVAAPDHVARIGNLRDVLAVLGP